MATVPWAEPCLLNNEGGVERRLNRMPHTAPQRTPTHPAWRCRTKGTPLKSLALAAALCASSWASAADIVPYAESWYAPSLAAARTNLGLNHAILSFGITRGSCVLDPTLLSRLPDARQFVNMGGKLSISMGGADGVYVEAACSDDQMFALMDKLMQDAGTRRLDWDIEGANLNNVDATARRNRVLLRLQAKYPDLYTSITLSAWFRGVNAASLQVVKSAVDAGVRVGMVNAMTQSFGANNINTMLSPATLSQATIVSFNATRDQMQTLFPSKTRAQLHAMMGMTPMIGWNDDGTVFTLADAKTVADFVKTNGIGMLGYWAFTRDKAQSTAGLLPVNNYTGVVQSAYQFLNIFKTAEGPVSSTAAAPVPSPAPAPAPGSYAEWNATSRYVAGDIVSRLGKLYQATALSATTWNVNSSPEWSTTLWTVYAPPVAAPAPAPAPAPSPAPAPAPVSFSEWNATTRYTAGDIVSHLGKLYQATALSATSWNVNSLPEWSTTLWTLYTPVAPAAPAPAVVVAPAPTLAVPAPAPAPAPALCSAAPASTVWVQGKLYAVGSVVSYSGKLYRAKYANPGYVPSISTYYWALVTSSVAAWVQSQNYAAGAIVSDGGKLYQANLANKGFKPSVSTTYWATYSC